MSEVRQMDGRREPTWHGYLRSDGRLGIRNRVLVVYTVKCAEFVARRIVERSASPEVELAGFDGCTDNQYAVDMLIALIRHPNVGAVLAVGLGCEYVQPEWLSDIARDAGKPTDWLFIQREGGTSILMITHNLGVVAEVCDEVYVMYAGEIVERADVYTLFRECAHPYTRGLMASLPRMTPKGHRLYNIKGTVPNLRAMPAGCRFAPRCEKCSDRCLNEKPALTDLGGGHLCRCFDPETLEDQQNG